jgi:hypothetical protein
VFAWGGEGHQVVALIAEKHLSDRAEAGIHELLGDNANISDAEVCNWADQIRRERRETAPWHYVNIPTTAPGYVATRDGNGGDDVIDAIGRFKRVLSDRAAPKENRAEALKFLVHFVGDIHQPLHCADRDGDKGGNGRLVFFLDRQKAVSLHSVWDTWLLRSYIGNRRIAEYADKLDAQIKSDNAKAWHEGTLEKWANESHAVARDTVYADVSADGPPPKLDQKYVDDARPVVEQQLQRGGVRLAGVPNRALSAEVGAEAATTTSATRPSSDQRSTADMNLFGDYRIRLVIRADDFGFSHASNMALLRLLDEGSVTAVGVIVTTGWLDKTVEILKKHPEVSVGVHVCLNSEWVPYKWGPVLPAKDVPSLVDDWGHFFGTRKDLLAHQPNADEVEREIRA